MESGQCVAAYFGPELPAELSGLRGLVWVPLVRVRPREDDARRAAELLASGAYDCAAITSPRGVGVLRAALGRWPESVRPYCIGAGTSRAFADAFGLTPRVPEVYDSAGLARAIASDGCRRVVTIRSSAGDDELERSLLSSGIDVVRVDVYDELLASPPEVPSFTVAIVTSSAIARAFCERVWARSPRAVVIAMGPKTEAALRSSCRGLGEVLVPQERSFKAIRSLLKALGCG